jgi:hypothetical protein
VAGGARRHKLQERLPDGLKAMPALSIPVPMSVPTILRSHLVDRFPDGILTSSSRPPVSCPKSIRHPQGDNGLASASRPHMTGTCSPESWTYP